MRCLFLFAKGMQQKTPELGSGFRYVFFHPLFGEDSHFDVHIFQMGLKPPTREDLGFVFLAIFFYRLL